MYIEFYTNLFTLIRQEESSVRREIFVAPFNLIRPLFILGLAAIIRWLIRVFIVSDSIIIGCILEEDFNNNKKTDVELHSSAAHESYIKF